MDFSLIVKIFLLVKKISPLMKNLHFWTDFDETLRDECTNELLHLPNLQQNRTKIVDFLLMVTFLKILDFTFLVITNYWKAVPLYTVHF